MKHPELIPLDRAMAPDKHFDTEAQRWWDEECESYGQNETYGFEVYSTSILNLSIREHSKTCNFEKDDSHA